jgi:hypothetical protein
LSRHYRPAPLQWANTMVRGPVSVIEANMSANSALLTDAFSSLRCAYGAAKRGR